MLVVRIRVTYMYCPWYAVRPAVREFLSCTTLNKISRQIIKHVPAATGSMMNTWYTKYTHKVRSIGNTSKPTRTDIYIRRIGPVLLMSV